MKDFMMNRTALIVVGSLLCASGCAQVSARKPISPAKQFAAAARKSSNPSPFNVSPASASQAANGAHSSASKVVPASHQGPASSDGSQGQTAVSNYSLAAGPAPESVDCYAAENCFHDPSVGQSCGPFPSNSAPAYWNDQEYLYDGGDRDPKVEVLSDWTVRGLDSQDTIAHYETFEGKQCVAASNRVPIYAPRFGAVRKVAAPILAARSVGALRLVEPNAAVVRRSDDLPNNVVMPAGPKHQTAVKLLDGLHVATRGVPAEKITQLANLTNFQSAFHRLHQLGTTVRREDLLALIGEYMVHARTSTTPESISVAIDGVLAVHLRDAKQVQDIHVYESEPGKCSLRICKAASHSAANPGDTIQFAIRFDNFGEKPIGNIIILDSLTTRLDYIDGSQQCVLSLATAIDAGKNPVKFSTTENEAGSTVLKWEADMPLATGDSGVITFRCRVR